MRKIYVTKDFPEIINRLKNLKYTEDNKPQELNLNLESAYLFAKMFEEYMGG